jgi:hypothetical protein
MNTDHAPLTLIDASQRHTVDCQGLIVIIILPSLPHCKVHKDHVRHTTHAIEWQMQRLVPSRIESVVNHSLSVVGDCSSGGSLLAELAIVCRGLVLGAFLVYSLGQEWRLSPVGDVEGHFDVGVWNGFSKYFLTLVITERGKLLSRDNLKPHTVNTKKFGIRGEDHSL